MTFLQKTTSIGLSVIFSTFTFLGDSNAAPASTISKVSKVRASASGSVYIMPVQTLNGACANDGILYATTNKAENDRILKLAMSALLADRNVKIQYDNVTCQISWIELR